MPTSINLEISKSVLLSLVRGNAQQTLDTTCIAPVAVANDTIFVDHADVTNVTLTVPQPSAAQFAVQVGALLVTRTAVMASPNGVPAGVAAPLVITLQLTINGTVLSLACTDVEPSSGPFASAAQQIKQSIGTVATVDFATLFSQLGLGTPSTSTIGETNDTLLIRFDPAGPAVNHRQPGQDWCLFIEAPTIVSLIQTKLSPVNAALTSRGATGVADQINWAPHGTTPHVDTRITFAYPVPDPFVLFATISIGSDFVLTHGISASTHQEVTDLDIICSWDLSVDLGALNFLAGDIANIAKTAIANGLNPASFGAVASGPDQFSFDEALPVMAFGGGVLGYSSVVGLADGMALGGPVTGILTASVATIAFDLAQFPTDFTLWVDCQNGGKPPSATLANVSVSAQVSYAGAGKLCSVDIVSPQGPPISLTSSIDISPGVGTITDSGSISIKLSSVAAAALATGGQPVRLLVKTARGVRLVDLGTPPSPQLANGLVVNVVVQRINDCPSGVDPWYKFFHMYNPIWGVDGGPDAGGQVERSSMFESSLVRLAGLQPGELIVFEMPANGRRAVFTAPASGELVIPIMLTMRSFDERAGLLRVNRQPLQIASVTTMLFERVAAFATPGALSHTLQGDSGRALLTTSYADRTQTILMDELMVPRTVGRKAGGIEAIMGEEKATPTTNGWKLDLPQVAAIHPVIGFENSDVAIAQMTDGSYLALQRGENGTAKVTGVVSSWPHMPPVSGRWAISSGTGDRVILYRMCAIAMPCNCAS